MFWVNKFPHVENPHGYCFINFDLVVDVKRNENSEKFPLTVHADFSHEPPVEFTRADDIKSYAKTLLMNHYELPDENAEHYWIKWSDNEIFDLAKIVEISMHTSSDDGDTEDVYTDISVRDIYSKDFYFRSDAVLTPDGLFNLFAELHFTDTTEFLKSVSGIKKDEDLAAFLNQSIYSILDNNELSVRSCNCLKLVFGPLKKATVKDLVKTKAETLAKTRNFGKKSLEEISEFLLDHDLTLGMTDESIQFCLFRQKHWLSSNKEEI